MNILLTNSTFDQAERFFHTAMEEYSRPEEDVVPYMVCQSAYSAVLNYLKSYIEAHERASLESDTPEVLLSECRIINSGFNDLNLDIFKLKDENDDALMSMSTMQRYMNILSQTRQLVGLN
ncbi:MAG: hypothetical protein ABJN36_15615 [Cyclobacteriaceae bacterium]